MAGVVCRLWTWCVSTHCFVYVVALRCLWCPTGRCGVQGFVCHGIDHVHRVRRHVRVPQRVLFVRKTHQERRSRSGLVQGDNRVHEGGSHPAVYPSRPLTAVLVHVCGGRRVREGQSSSRVLVAFAHGYVCARVWWPSCSRAPTVRRQQCGVVPRYRRWRDRECRVLLVPAAHEQHVAPVPVCQVRVGLPAIW